MKKFIVYFVSVIMFVMVISCQKVEMEEVINNPEAIIAQSVDTTSFQKQLAVIQNLTKKQVFDSLSVSTGLKSATIVDLNHITLMPISSNDYYICDDEATKIYDYMIKNLNGHIKDEFTINQIFQIKNGIVDSLDFRIEYEVGPPTSSRGFYLKSNNYLSRTTFHWHGDNGEQNDFYGESSNSYHVLPNYPNGFWQLVFDFNINGEPRTYESQPIDYYAESNALLLNLQLQVENTVSVIELDKSLIKDANRLEIQGYDESGTYRYMTIPVVYNERMPRIISYSFPIDVSFVYICVDTSYSYYSAKCVGIKSGNISIFNLEKIW